MECRPARQPTRPCSLVVAFSSTLRIEGSHMQPTPLPAYGSEFSTGGTRSVRALGGNGTKNRPFPVSSTARHHCRRTKSEMSSFRFAASRRRSPLTTGWLHTVQSNGPICRFFHKTHRSALFPNGISLKQDSVSVALDLTRLASYETIKLLRESRERICGLHFS